MASATVLILIKSALVVDNGMTPDAFTTPPSAAQIGIVSSLLMPNGIQAAQTNQVTASITIPMQNGAPAPFDLTDPYSKGAGPEIPLQFKILIDDQCPLNVELNYTENASLFGTILSSVIGALGGTVSSLVPGGTIITAALTGVVGFLGDKLKSASGGHIQPIGTGSLRITVNKLTPEPQEFTVPLIAPNDVFRSWFKPNPDPATKNDTPFVQDSGNVITKGQANGQVVFVMSTIS